MTSLLAAPTSIHPSALAFESPEGHYELFRKKYGSYYPLPSENTGIFINWDGEYYTITVKLPIKERKIKAEWYRKVNGKREDRSGEVDIVTPDLLLQTTIRRFDLIPIKDYRILEYHSSFKRAISARPYMLSNVYEDARICFGNKNITNLRQANVTFWDGPFNPDILPPNRRDWPWQHRRCRNVSKHVNDSCGKINPQNAHHHYNISHTCECSTADPWTANTFYCNGCGGFIPTDEEMSKRVEEHLERLNTLCICSFLQENCPCVCQCNCCAGRCSCPCDCSLEEEYFKYLRGYNGDDYGLEWSNHNRSILGRNYNSSDPRFLSFPQSASALFISRDVGFINEVVGADYAKQHLGELVVFGFVRELDADTYLVMFAQDKVIPIKKSRVDHSIL